MRPPSPPSPLPLSPPLCLQVRLTGGLQQYLPSFLPSLLGFGATPAIDKLCVDNERHILYSLSQNSAIQV